MGLIEKLKDFRIILKSGDYDGGDIMGAWCAMALAADALERLKGYARHTASCASVNRFAPVGECTCGLSDLLKEIDGHD